MVLSQKRYILWTILSGSIFWLCVRTHGFKRACIARPTMEYELICVSTKIIYSLSFRYSGSEASRPSERSERVEKSPNAMVLPIYMCQHKGAFAPLSFWANEMKRRISGIGTFFIKYRELRPLSFCHLSERSESFRSVTQWSESRNIVWRQESPK